MIKTETKLSEKISVGKVTEIEAYMNRELTDAQVKKIKALGIDHVVVYHGFTVVRTTPENFPIEGFNYSLRRNIIVEDGGAVTGSSEATIYADLSGKPLRNFRLERSGCGKFAYGYVAVPLFFSTVCVETAGPRFDGKRITVSIETVDAETLNIEREVMWESKREIYPDELTAMLPGKMQKYKKAIVAALKKADDYHCHQTYFYEV